MTKFQKAMDHILKVEGGFVNNPLDKGGPTKYGITIHTLRDWRMMNVSAQDVEHLTIEEATEIYRKMYWELIHGDELDEVLALVLFDQAVNWGPKAAIIVFQKALNFGWPDTLKEDGIMGPNTLTMAQHFTNLSFMSSSLGQIFLAFSMKKYAKLEAPFHRQWMARIARLQMLLCENFRAECAQASQSAAESTPLPSVQDQGEDTTPTSC